MSYGAEEIDKLIATRRADVEAALRTTLDGLLLAPTLEALEKLAPMQGMTTGELIVDQLGKINFLVRFGKALDLRLAPTEVEPPEDEGIRVDPKRFNLLANRAEVFRCRILVNDTVAGSACLVGPGTVLTAWHVIAVGPPSVAQEPPPTVEVLLSDNTRLPVRLPPEVASMCGDAEYTGTAPRSDVEVDGRNDVALLRLRQPLGSALGYAPLPASVPPATKPGIVFLFDFPNGQDDGVGWGKVSRIPGVTARWRHSIETAPGSSGGAAFGDTYELIGLHQGRWKGKGRLVPARLFLDAIRAAVAADQSPTTLWTLDPSLRGRLVIGRDPFVQGVGAAARSETRIRGVHVRRRDPRTAPAGLSFSYDILKALLARLGPGHRPVRLSTGDPRADLDAGFREQLKDRGLEVPPAADGAGVQVGQAALEAVLKDRARLLADAIDAAAQAREETVWLFLDHPSNTPEEPGRLFLEAFVAAALLRQRIRLVISGYETWHFAGEEFTVPADADGDGAPGFVTEYIGWFTVRDVENTLRRAAQDLLKDQGVNEDTATPAAAAVDGIENVNGTYADEHLKAVASVLQRTVNVYVARADQP
jgi:hypothetical protein